MEMQSSRSRCLSTLTIFSTRMETTSENMIESFFSSQSDISSVTSQHDVPDAHMRLDIYQPRDRDDPTQVVLSAFLNYLPTEGRQNIAKFVHLCNDTILYELCQHLVTAILLPSKINYSNHISYLGLLSGTKFYFFT
jgi:hypothetical protein